jgi:hypothetical protein
MPVAAWRADRSGRLRVRSSVLNANVVRPVIRASSIVSGEDGAASAGILERRHLQDADAGCGARRMKSRCIGSIASTSGSIVLGEVVAAITTKKLALPAASVTLWA